MQPDETPGREQPRERLAAGDGGGRLFALLMAAVEQNHDSYTIADMDGRIIHANPAAAALLHTTPAHLLTMRVLDLAPPEARDLYAQTIRDIVKTRHWMGRIPVQRVDGTRFTAAFEATLLVDEAGNPMGILGVARDITEQLAREHELARFKYLVDHAGEEFYLVRTDGSITYVNGAVCRSLGYSFEELTHMKVFDLNDRLGPQEWQQLLAQTRQGEKLSLEVRHRAKDGHTVPTEVTIVYVDLDGEGYLCIFAHDISARKALEAERREALAFRERITQISPAIIAIYTLPERTLVYTNPRAEEVTGYSPEVFAHLSPKLIAEMVHPEDLPRVEQHIAALAAAADGEVITVEYRLRHRDGRWLWLLSRDTVFARSPDGRPSRILSVTHDVTTQKTTEEALQTQRRLLDTFITHVPAAIAVFDREMRYLAVSRRWMEDYGLDDRQIIGLSHYEVFPEIGEEWKAIHRASLAGATMSREEDAFRRADGSIDWVKWEIVPWYGPDGRIGGIIMFTEVITQRKRREDVLRRLNRALRVLSRVDQAIIHAREEYALLQEACRIAVEEGGYRMAWVGYVEHDPARTIRPVACGGTDEGYLESLRVSWGENPWGQGPAGMAVRSGAPYIINDTNADPRFVPWREEAIKRGYASVVALPLTSDSHPSGVIVIYATEPHAFSTDDVALLKELADNVGYGIGILRLREARRHAEEELRRSEARYRQMVETAREGIWTVDTEGYTTYVNQRAAEMLGYRPAEMMGQPLLQYIAEDQCEEVTRLLAAGKEHPIQHDRHFIRRDGSDLWAIVSSTPLRDERGRVSGSFAMLTDITERKHAEKALQESEEKFRTLAESAPAVIGIVQGTRFAYVNPYLEHISGYTQGELQGMEITQLLHVDYQALVAERALQRQRGETPPPYYEFKMVTKSGEPRWIDLSVARIEYRGKPAVIGTGIDITERKVAEDALREERAFLSATIDLLPFPVVLLSPEGHIIRTNRAAQDFQGADGLVTWWESRLVRADTQTPVPTEELPGVRALHGETPPPLEVIGMLPNGHEANLLVLAAPVYVDGHLMAAVVAVQDITMVRDSERAGNRFLDIISHELKTPLTAILGWAQLAETDRELVPEALAGILRSARHQRDMINDLIDVSRLFQRRLELRRTSADLWQIAEDTAQEELPTLQARHLTFSCQSPDGPLPVLADVGRMRLVLHHLLDNAAKYTDPGGQVTMAGHREGDWAVISIKDTGRGIPADALPSLFRPFRQIGRSESIGGLGLGLVLVRGIVELHGGTVTAESPGPGQGSTFTMRLPLLKEPPAGQHPAG